MDVDVAIAVGISVGLRNFIQQGVEQSRKRNRAVLVSISEHHWTANTVELFERARYLTTDRFYWSQPDRAFAFVGFGTAYSVEPVEESRFRQVGTSWQELLQGAVVEGPHGLPGVGPLLIGGFAFDPAHAATDLWSGYGTGRMVLPEILYTVHNSEAWLTYNILATPDTDPDAKAAAITSLRDVLFTSANYRNHRTNGTRQRVTQRELVPADTWKAAVAATAADIAKRNSTNALKKAVLARAVRLEASNEFDTAAALHRLAEQYPHCFVFAVAHGDSCFLGATPERLAEVHNGQLQTMSLAGSTRRGVTEAEDCDLGTQLLRSAKDRDEHAVVVQMLTETLTPLCNDLYVVPSPSLLKLKNVQHLCTPIRGKLRDPFTLLDVIERLHPTPAVGGRPRDAAFEVIRQREGLDRGWYAGPVGWIDGHGEGEFAVAIRSALVTHTTATLFAGCGIVAESDPEREYAESRLKLKPMFAALSVSDED